MGKPAYFLLTVTTLVHVQCRIFPLMDGEKMRGMFILHPERPTSAIKYLEILHSTHVKKKTVYAPQYAKSTCSIIPRIIYLFSLSCGRETFSKIQSTKESIASQRKSRELNRRLGEMEKKNRRIYNTRISMRQNDTVNFKFPCCHRDVSSSISDRKG